MGGEHGAAERAQVFGAQPIVRDDLAQILVDVLGSDVAGRSVVFDVGTVPVPSAPGIGPDPRQPPVDDPELVVSA